MATMKNTVVMVAMQSILNTGYSVCYQAQQEVLSVIRIYFVYQDIERICFIMCIRCAKLEVFIDCEFIVPSAGSDQLFNHQYSLTSNHLYFFITIKPDL